MEKILLVQDTGNTNSGALDFACYLATLTNSKITGVFPDFPENENRLVLNELEPAGASGWQAGKPIKGSQAKHETINNHISSFKQSCERRSNRYTVHVDNGEPEKEILDESRYADLLVIDPGATFRQQFEGLPSPLVRNILKNAECPVVIAPEIFEGIEEIVFTYDGSKSAMFAIKQFCYLFPQLDEKKVTLIQAECNNPESARGQENLKEWLSAHYSSIGITSLNGDAETELSGYLLKKENAFIVMGTYGRSLLSEMFKRSTAGHLAEIPDQAIFIAHC